MINLQFYSTRDLVLLDSSTVVQGDDNVQLVRVSVPVIMENKDVSECKFILKFLIGHTYFEESLVLKENTGTTLILETTIQSHLTFQSGTLYTALSVYSEEPDDPFTINSKTTKITIRKSIRTGLIGKESQVEKYVREMRAMLDQALELSGTELPNLKEELAKMKELSSSFEELIETFNTMISGNKAEMDKLNTTFEDFQKSIRTEFQGLLDLTNELQSKHIHLDKKITSVQDILARTEQGLIDKIGDLEQSAFTAIQLLKVEMQSFAEDISDIQIEAQTVNTQISQIRNSLLDHKSRLILIETELREVGLQSSQNSKDIKKLQENTIVFVDGKPNISKLI